MGGRDSQGVWHQHVNIAIFEMDNPHGLTVYHRKLLYVMWQPGWDGSLQENRYMYMYGRAPSPFT